MPKPYEKNGKTILDRGTITISCPGIDFDFWDKITGILHKGYDKFKRSEISRQEFEQMIEDEIKISIDLLDKLPTRE